MKQIRKRLTYANVMSSIAVFFVLGGATAFAATKIGANELKANSIKTGKIVKEAVTTSKLKNNSITTGKIDKDAVTGDKVNEATLSQVPSAATAVNAMNAVNATNAINATNVGGVFTSKINYNANPISGPQAIFSRAGLTLTAACASGANISVEATTSKNDASIYTTVVNTDMDDNNSNDDLESGDFDLGDKFNLLAKSEGNPGLATFEYDANDGTTVTGTLSVDEDNEPGADCQAHGVVFSG